MSSELRDMSLRFAKKIEKIILMNYLYENDYYEVWFEVLKDPYTQKEYPEIYTGICFVPKDNHPDITGCVMQDRRLTPLKGETEQIQMGHFTGFFLDKEQKFVDVDKNSDILYQEAKALVYECDRIARTDFENCSVLPRKGEEFNEVYFSQWKKMNDELGKKQDEYMRMKVMERERAKEKSK